MRSILIMFMVVFAQVGFAQSNLPACNGNFTSACFAEYRFPNGNRYIGEWANEQFHGQGTFNMNNGDVYAGQFVYGKNHGQGTYTWANGQRYVGQFVNSLKSGQGTYTWPNGNRYVGQWSGDRNNGQGTLFYADGSKYIGQWRDSKQEGKGIYFKADGSISQEGIWRDNVFVQALHPPVPPPSNLYEENIRTERAPVRPAAPPRTIVQQNPVDRGVESAQDIKRKKCLRLGLAPGSLDYAQCLQ